jgi:hypothetical protein
MILTLFVQVLQELNAILLIVDPLLAPHALILSTGSLELVLTIFLCLLSWEHKTLEGSSFSFGGT